MRSDASLEEEEWEVAEWVRCDAAEGDGKDVYPVTCSGVLFLLCDGGVASLSEEAEAWRL